MKIQKNYKSNQESNTTKTPDQNVGRLDDIEQQKKDEKQQDDIFRMAKRLKRGLILIFVIILVYICYSQCGGN